MKTKSSSAPENIPRGAQSGRRSKMSGLRIRLRRSWAKIIDTSFLKAGEIQPSFFANIDLNDYILVTVYKLWVQNGLSRRLPIEGIFFSRPLSTSGTAVVAKSNPPSVAPQTDAILIKQPLQLYFPRTFRQISFSGYFLAVFNAYQVEGCFFGRLNLRGFSIKLRSLKTE